jgi:1-acyl-sn-glycerol-3-phosphate acyltransferase
MLYGLLKHVLVGPALRVGFQPWIEGTDNIPAEGPAILASNHLSFSDSVFLPLLTPRRITFMAKAEYFTGKGVKGRLTAATMNAVGQVPVDRSGGRGADDAIRTGVRLLAEDHLVGIYPEGTRSPDGKLYRGRTGVARMALEAKVPVIPVAMIDTEKVQPPGRAIPHLGRVGMVIGEPMTFDRYHGMEGERLVLRAVTDEIMYAIWRLSNQEYVDIYATTAKARIARGEPTSPSGSPRGSVA